MTAIKLDGEKLAAKIREELRGRVESLDVVPGLGTVLVGDDGPSANYVAMKHRDCEELGMKSFHEHLPADATQEAVNAVVDQFNAAPHIHAYLMQYPFPKHLDFEDAMLRVWPEKDVDGLHPVNLGRLVQGVSAPLACTPAGIQRMLVEYDIPIEGSKVVIVGRGLTIGRPLANLLSLKRPHANAAVTVVHTGVKDLGSYTREAEVLIAAAGFPHLIKADMVRPGAAVVAAGVSFEGKKIVSDVAPEVEEVAGWLSPRIGGVGPMTRAMLMVNAVEAAERAAG